MKTTIPSVLMIVAIACVAADAPKAHAVVPPPDGGYPGLNTAEGQNALFSLTTGVGNAAVGSHSLFSNTDGSFNTAVGAGTLLFNIGNQNTGEGTQNTAIGTAALLFNNTGSFNTATGVNALSNNITGASNTAIGYQALVNNNASGSFNTALGADAGYNIAAGSGNVCIGAGVLGDAGVNDTTWIRNVYDSFANGRAVYVNSDNKIGTLASSRRFKEEIKPMDKASEVLFALKPVSFRYKKEFDARRAPMFGLIAEDVEQVNPDLVSRNEKGEVETVRYEQINAMLLNEFLKEHRKVQELEKGMATLAAQFKEQAAQLQKVSALVEASTAPRRIANND